MLNELRQIKELLGELVVERKLMRTAPLAQAKKTDILDDLIDGVDVKAILKVSDRTLCRIKKSNLVNTIKIGKRDYYSKTEIAKLVAFFMK